MIRFVIQDLEKFLGFCLYCPDKNLPIRSFLEKYVFPVFHILSPLKEFRPEIPAYIHTIKHMYMRQSFKTLMTRKRTFIVIQEGIVGVHVVLALPCRLLDSSMLPQHLHKPHSLAMQNLLSAIHDMHWSLLEGPIYINNKLALIHYMSRIWSVLPEHRDVKYFMNP